MSRDVSTEFILLLTCPVPVEQSRKNMVQSVKQESKSASRLNLSSPTTFFMDMKAVSMHVCDKESTSRGLLVFVAVCGEDYLSKSL